MSHAKPRHASLAPPCYRPGELGQVSPSRERAPRPKPHAAHALRNIHTSVSCAAVASVPANREDNSIIFAIIHIFIITAKEKASFTK